MSNPYTNDKTPLIPQSKMEEAQARQRHFSFPPYLNNPAAGQTPSCRRREGHRVASVYMTLSKIMTLLSSAPGESELRDLTSGAMYSR